MSGFPDLIEDLDDMVMGSLSDGSATYLARNGQVLAEHLPVIVGKDVERFDGNGMVDRVRTHCVQRHLLQPLDRQGAFVMDGRTWHIDGIAEDDGHLITFYVVP